MLKTPENERFVAEFKKRMDSMPANEGPNGYVGVHAIVDAINAVNGDLSDTMKFIAALKAVKFNSPKGEISLDKYGQVIQTMYIREVQKVDGQLANVPIATYHERRSVLALSPRPSSNRSSTPIRRSKAR